MPPCAVGSVSGPTVSSSSMTEPGQPCVMISGNAFSCRDFDEVDRDPVDLGRELRERVQFRLGPTLGRSRSSSSGRAPAASSAARPGSGLQRALEKASVFASIWRRSSTSCSSGISTWKGRMSMAVSATRAHDDLRSGRAGATTSCLVRGIFTLLVPAGHSNEWHRVRGPGRSAVVAAAFSRPSLATGCDVDRSHKT